ncbi:MAG TPA: TlpA disulfide reductase family protein [Chitinophagaceae bacterium]|nr:TlpA disulfide reductase family protein [Chitinophagaceae bacterium]
MLNYRSLFILSVNFFLITAAYAQPPRQGQMASDIALPTVKGDTVRLSSLKGKVVLLDFWASWCGPCRAANRGLTKLYGKFKDKGFEIYSVSLDDEKDAWVKAIRQDKINWLQVIEKGGWETATAKKWEIYALPTSYLIDKDGRLVAMDLEGKQLEKALKDMLDN